jgi:hypothetical protein
MILLLGIHWGHFSESLPIKRKKKLVTSESKGTGDQFEEYIEGMSGMTCVIPVWRITALLNCEKLVQQRMKEDSLRASRAISPPASPTPES